MRFNRPFELGILAAFTIIFCLLITLVPLKYLEQIQISWLLIMVIALVSAVLVFVVVSWSVNRFLYSKVKLIYKTILSQKIRKDTKNFTPKVY